MASGPLALCADFVFEGRPVRIARNGELWFVLADACQAMEILNPSQVANRLDPDERGICNVDTPSGPQEMLIVSEPGLYKLIATSRKPVAVRFDRFVRHEVLPSIRKYGCYPPPVDLTPPPAMAEFFNQFTEFKGEVRNEFKQVNAKLSLIVDNSAKGRKDPTLETQRIHGKVIRYHYFCKCPCGECDITIMDENGFIPKVSNYHHQFNRWDNRPTATIPLAEDCHKRIERDADARTRFGAKAFPMFQALLARLRPRQPRLPLGD
jgi:prophage antirepressor-like protein